MRCHEIKGIAGCRLGSDEERCFVVDNQTSEQYFSGSMNFMEVSKRYGLSCDLVAVVLFCCGPWTALAQLESSRE